MHMDHQDNTSFLIEWGAYASKLMSFILKNVQRPFRGRCKKFLMNILQHSREYS